MEMNNDGPLQRKRYKQYLQPNSDIPVPMTSVYRSKKNFKKIESENVSNLFPHDEPNEDLFYTDENYVESDNFIGNEDFNKDESTLNGLETEIIENNIRLEENTNKLSAVIENLTEEFDEIENTVEQCQEEEEEDDFFQDAIDEDLFLNEGIDEEEKMKYEDILDAENLKKPINRRVIRSIGEVLLMLIKFTLVHALSLTATCDLFSLINCLFDESVLPATKYFIDKLFYPKNNTHLHGTCPTCGSYMGKFTRKDKTLNCKLCKVDINVKNYAYKDFFVTMDIKSPISKLLEANYESYNNIVNERSYQKGYRNDVYDRKEYRQFLKNLGPMDRQNYASVIFNTDGAPIFSSSTYSIWPIFLMLNELPFHIRSKELILAGLWFGKDKPNMNVFLGPFVEIMNDISTSGVQCIMNGVSKLIKVFCLICCCDSVARAPVQGFVQFNGKYGCGLCLHPGKWILNKANLRSGNIKYPLLNTVPKPRNRLDTIKQMEKATKLQKPVFGVKNASHLINLQYFDIILGCVPDSLHLVTGVSKLFTTAWFGNSKKSGLFVKNIVLEIDSFLNKIKVPHQICRLTRTLSERASWKAREWENWIMYYSLPILINILPEDLFNHWALFVEALYLLSKENIHISEIERADYLLHEFVALTEKLYSKALMTFNMHLLLHLAKSVDDWGPLWCHNTYAFESGNGDLLKIIHASKGIYHQICRRECLKYTMITLKDRTMSSASHCVKQFFTKIGTSMVQKSIKISGRRYFGPPRKISEFWLQKLETSFDKTVSYQKMVYNGCLYMSSYKTNKRSDNTYAQLSDGCYVNLVFFIVNLDSGIEYTVVKKVETADSFENECKTIRKIVKVDDSESAILTSNISKICVHINVNDSQYLCTVPSLHFY